METLVIDQKTFKASHIPTPKADILLILGTKGFLGCAYFKVESADKLGEAVAIVTGVKSYQDMQQAKVIAASAKARELGIDEGMSGRDALLKLA